MAHRPEPHDPDAKARKAREELAALAQEGGLMDGLAVSAHRERQRMRTHDAEPEPESALEIRARQTARLLLWAVAIACLLYAAGVI